MTVWIKQQTLYCNYYLPVTKSKLLMKIWRTKLLIAYTMKYRIFFINVNFSYKVHNFANNDAYIIFNKNKEKKTLHFAYDLQLKINSTAYIGTKNPFPIYFLFM